MGWILGIKKINNLTISMSFKPLRKHSGKEVLLPVTASATLTKFSTCKMSSGYLVAGAAGDDEVEYIALETVTGGSSDGDVYALVLRIDETIEFLASTGTTPVQATHVGNDYDLGSAAALDLTATTDKVFHIDSIVDATNKLVIGRFNKPALA